MTLGFAPLSALSCISKPMPLPGSSKSPVEAARSSAFFMGPKSFWQMARIKAAATAMMQ